MVLDLDNKIINCNQSDGGVCRDTGGPDDWSAMLRFRSWQT